MTGASLLKFWTTYFKQPAVDSTGDECCDGWNDMAFNLSQGQVYIHLCTVQMSKETKYMVRAGPTMRV